MDLTSSIRASEFLRSDVVLRYRKVDGGKATLVLRCCDGWRFVEVSMNDKEELLNPVDVVSGRGVKASRLHFTACLHVP
jgi:hypothetical protein